MFAQAHCIVHGPFTYLVTVHPLRTLPSQCFNFPLSSEQKQAGGEVMPLWLHH